MNGIDVSRWQPADITALVDYDFAIIKATEGLTYVSPTCDAQYQAAKKRGKKVGVYHFASGLDAVAEADFFIKNVQGYVGEAVLVLDWEASAIARGAAWVKQFVERVKEITGVPPMIYGSLSPLTSNGIFAVAQESNCGLWVAAYPDNNAGGFRGEQDLLGGVIRQYTSKGRLPGYDGNLDLNYSSLTPEAWDKYARGTRGGETPAPVVPTPPAKKSNEDIANEVLAGVWGNGEERKQRLSNAGYDPSAVQNAVNQKLGEKPAKKSNETIADEVLNGAWGNGNDRRNRLAAAGYDYDAVQNIVDGKLGAKPLGVGSTVQVTNAVDVNGVRLGTSGNYTVMQINGSRVVIGRGGQVTAALNAANLKVV